LFSLVFSQLGFGTNLPWFRVPSVFSSLVRSRAAVLLGYASNILHEPIFRYGKLGFQFVMLFWVVLELVTDFMNECFDLMCEDALYAWLIREKHGCCR